MVAAVRWVCFVAVVAAAQHSAVAQAPDDAVAVAVVNGRPITFLQVKRMLAAAVDGRQVPAELVPMLQAQSLEQAVLRRLVIDRLKEMKYEPTAAELKQAQENFESNLTLGGLSREEFLRRGFLTEADLDDLRYWEICWNRYADEQLTAPELQRFFDAHRRDFDGTELRVSHVLLRIEGRGDQSNANVVLARAAEIREEIVAKKITFAEAAQKYSSGPSRDVGGDLGFIGRHEPMVEEFNAAAFKMQKGEISPPTVTPFGVHLITVTDERPGTNAWTDVINPLTAAARQDLFRRTAAELRKTAKVEYTNLVPHFDPATGRIFVPNKPPAP